MYYVYLIQNEAGEIYTGFTKDLRKRLQSHNEGLNKATKGHQWQLVYYEAFRSEADARKREKSLKAGRARRWLRERIQGSLTPDK
jgi:putative endonuclease